MTNIIFQLISFVSLFFVGYFVGCIKGFGVSENIWKRHSLEVKKINDNYVAEIKEIYMKHSIETLEHCKSVINKLNDYYTNKTNVKYDGMLQ